MLTLGFIGTGNMGGALATAAAKRGGVRLLLANRTAAKAEKLASLIGGELCDNTGIAKTADYIFLGVKPQMMEDMLSGIAGTLAGRETPFVLVTMAGGLTIGQIRKMAGADYPVIRIMPNTPVSVGEGMTFYACSENVSKEALDTLLNAMSASGRLAALDEKLIDAGASVAGCGPAFLNMFIEALADGGVACGLPRKQAMEFAAQMVMGSAKLLLESGKHPGELKDAVCSPGGTTIQGVRALEKGGFRSAVMDAVIAAYEKNKDFH